MQALQAIVLILNVLALFAVGSAEFIGTNPAFKNLLLSFYLLSVVVNLTYVAATFPAWEKSPPIVRLRGLMRGRALFINAMGVTFAMLLTTSFFFNLDLEVLFLCSLIFAYKTKAGVNDDAEYTETPQVTEKTDKAGEQK